MIWPMHLGCSRIVHKDLCTVVCPRRGKTHAPAQIPQASMFDRAISPINIFIIISNY